MTARRQSVKWASLARKVLRLSCWRIRLKPTTLSSARLCSCYPWPVLGLPPRWYKSDAYRARVVIEPRSVLKEFGLVLDESVEVRVWDSNSDIRYMVLPERPEGTEGMGEDELTSLVTRDSMVGVSKAKSPAPAM